ncbi:hypothetical protein N7468_008583 [Penicillium chermesinum]|uniref:Uncharacterized protein n=1 Tax=Penicillium chermesinum TaxID=63820 RepID=A0A9W9NQ02_9EURO|nr:uncharacterized protein N7468_008583 [Penicillium chermesinum]KAJ5224041.1 hypothetical protein N7468_008583 [Penicillium chermesinum]
MQTQSFAANLQLAKYNIHSHDLLLPSSHETDEDQLQLLSYNPTPYFLFFINATHFKEEFFNLESRKRFRFFNQNTLLIMAPRLEHAAAAASIGMEITGWIMGMNLQSQVIPSIGHGVSARDVPNEEKVPDGAFGPVRTPSGFPKRRPSITIEVGLSQTLPRLEDTAKWWLNPTKRGRSSLHNLQNRSN